MTTALPIANGRSVVEWRGKSPDEPFPPRVRLRIFDRYQGRCANCGRKIPVGDKWICDHRIALINAGENRESNGQPLCSWCNPEKNAADVAEKSKVYETRAKHLGIPLKQKRPWPKRSFADQSGRYTKTREAR